MKAFVLVTTAVAMMGCSLASTGVDSSETKEIERAAEFEVQTIVARAEAQSAIELTAQAPTLTPISPRPTPTQTPTALSTLPAVTPSPTATPTATPRPTPTPTATPRPTATPVPRFLGQQYLSADGVNVTLTTLDVNEIGNSTSVLIEYTVENTTADPKEEKAWKLFYQGTGGLYFGVLGELQPNQSIDRSFTLNAVAPNGLLALAYPSEFSDITWDGDDLIWNVVELMLP